MKNESNKGLALGAAGVAIAAAAAAAGAVLANKGLRDALGKKAKEALQTVSKMAYDWEKNAESKLKVLEEGTKMLAGETKSVKRTTKPRSKTKK